jgi:hypothetical protein
MKICIERVGGIWHGTIDGHPEIDERGLTEEIARRKILRVASQMEAARVKETESQQEEKGEPPG